MGSYEDMGFNTPPPVFDDLGFDDEILPQVEERSANLPVPTDEVSLIDTASLPYPVFQMVVLSGFQNP